MIVELGIHTDLHELPSQTFVNDYERPLELVPDCMAGAEVHCSLPVGTGSLDRGSAASVGGMEWPRCHGDAVGQNLSEVEV